MGKHRIKPNYRRRVLRLKEPPDLWDLEHYLTHRRKEIDRQYDYRYSQLTHVFGKLLYESRLREEELRGLREDKRCRGSNL